MTAEPLVEPCEHRFIVTLGVIDPDHERYGEVTGWECQECSTPFAARMRAAEPDTAEVAARYAGSVPGVPCRCGHLVSMHYDDGACRICPCAAEPDTVTADPKDYDDGVEAVHRAFCDPEHEAVGEWDREMADALRRNGLVITSVEDVARRLREWPRRNGGNHEAEARRLLGLTGEGGGSRG